MSIEFNRLINYIYQELERIKTKKNIRSPEKSLNIIDKIDIMNNKNNIVKIENNEEIRNNYVNNYRGGNKLRINDINLTNSIIIDGIIYNLNTSQNYQSNNITYEYGTVSNNYITEYKSQDYYDNLNLLIKNIRKNLDIMEKYNLYDLNNKNNLWIDNIKPYYDDIISKNLIEDLELDKIKKVYINKDDIDDSPKFENYMKNLSNINEWKLQTGGFNKKNIEDILDIKIIPYKELNIQNKKIISLSLFNVKFTDFKTPYNYNTTERKPPHFYTKVLNNAIDTYKKYMPDWILRLYIDETIPMDDYENQPSLPTETKKILKRFLTEDNMELLCIKSNYLIDKNNTYKHLKLTPVIFRYLSFFDENIISCFVADIDNTCTSLIANLLNNFQKSKNKFIIFKPVKSYDRPYFNNKCIDNFLAGMIGFNKEQGTILNYKIWQSLYKFFDIYYKELKSDKKYETCTVKILVDSPFYYGFEESGFTTIFSYLINKFNLPVYLIPLYWDYGMDPSEMISYCILTNQLYALTDEFLMFLFDLMKIKLNLQKSENIILLNSFKHAPLLLIISNIIYYLHFNNINEIVNPYTNLNIKVFKNKNLLNSILSVFPFVSGYTFDFKEVASDTSVCDIYGDEISTEIIKLIDLFEKKKYIEFKNKINELHKQIKINITEKFKTNNSYVIYKKTLEKNPDSILFDLEHPYSFSSLINNQYINYNYINNIPENINNLYNFKSLLFKPLNLDNIYNKTYDNIISLGDQFLDEFLFNNNLKKKYYPFELMVIDFDIFSDLINTNFKEIIDVKNYIDYDDSDTYQMKKNTSFNKYYKNLFMIDPRVKKNFEFLNDSIHNFEKIQNDLNVKKLFIMHIDYDNNNINNKYNYYYIYEKFNNIINVMSNTDIFIMITSKQNVYKENVILNYIFNNGNTLVITHIYTKSHHTSTKYLDENDNIMINNIFKNINFKYKDESNVNNYFKNRNIIINDINKFKQNIYYTNILSKFDDNYLLKMDEYNKILNLFTMPTQNIMKQFDDIRKLLIIALHKKQIMMPYEFIDKFNITDKENLCIQTIINELSLDLIKKIMVILSNNVSIDINNYIYYKIETKNLLKNFIDNNINIFFNELGIVNCGDIKLLGSGSSSSVYQIKDKAVKISVSTGKTYYNYYEYKNYKKILNSKDEYFKLFNVHIEDYIMNYYEHFYIDTIDNKYLIYNGEDVYLDCLVMEKIDNDLFNGIISNTIDKSYTEKIFNTLLRTLHIFHFNKLVHNDLSITNVGYSINNNNIKFKIIDYGDMCNVDNLAYILCNKSTHGGWNNLLYIIKNEPTQLLNDFNLLRSNDVYSLLLVLYEYYNLSKTNIYPITTYYRKNINKYITNLLNTNTFDDISIIEQNLNQFNLKLLDFIENINIPSIKQKCKILFNDNGQTDLNTLLPPNMIGGYKNKYLKYKQKYLELKNKYYYTGK
jgi:hypothetical protein